MDSSEEWIDGRLSLAAATDWSAKEIRIISELAFNLSEQGRNEEAIKLFEGLHIVTPGTLYFQTALGTLSLRVGQFEKAIFFLTRVLRTDPNDMASRVNRGEAFLRMGEIEKARSDLEMVTRTVAQKLDKFSEVSVARAKGLLYSIENGTFKI